MIRKSLLASFLVVSGFVMAGQAMDDKLRKGVGVNTENFSQLVPVSTHLSVARSVHRSIDAGFVYGFVANDEESVVYSLSRGPNLHAGNLETRGRIGSWPLARWRLDRYTPPEIVSRYGLYGISSDDEEFYPASISLYSVEEGERNFGCLLSSPVRYGDFTGDGNKEVVFIGDDVVVFSPQKEEVIFSQRIRVNDWLPVSEQQEVYDSIGGMDREKGAQFLSKIAIERWAGPRPDLLKAYRGYGKLFHGDFSGGESHDLLVWHKFYQSLLREDSVAGFEPVSNTFIHYLFVDGEYRKEDTPRSYDSQLARYQWFDLAVRVPCP